MVAAGQRRIAEILIIGEGGLGHALRRLPPGMREFAGEDAKIYIAGITGVRATFALGVLLPAAFGPSMTKADQL